MNEKEALWLILIFPCHRRQALPLSLPSLRDILLLLLNIVVVILCWWSVPARRRSAKRRLGVESSSSWNWRSAWTH